MVLPNAQDAAFLRVILPDPGLRIVYPTKDWIVRIDDTHKAVLIFGDAIVATLLLLPAVEGDDPRTETQSDQLMAAADSQHRCARRANEAHKVIEDFRLIVIKVAQRATEHNRVGTEIVDRIGKRGDMDDARSRLLYQPVNVADDVLQSQRRDLAFTLQMRERLLSPIAARDVGQITFIAQKIIDDQDASFIDGLLDGFVTAERLLVEREGKRLGRIGSDILLDSYFLKFLAHQIYDRLFSVSAIALPGTLLELRHARARAGLVNLIPYFTNQQPAKASAES